MEKFWIRSYPSGVPSEIDCTRYRSLVHLLEEAFVNYADRNAYTCTGKYISYAEVDDMSRRLGAWLQAQGLERGARVALMMPNVLQYPVAIAAVLRAGAEHGRDSDRILKHVRHHQRDAGTPLQALRL